MIGVFHIAGIWGDFVYYLSCVQNVYISVQHIHYNGLKNKTCKQTTKIDWCAEHACQQKPTTYVQYTSFLHRVISWFNCLRKLYICTSHTYYQNWKFGHTLSHLKFLSTEFLLRDHLNTVQRQKWIQLKKGAHLKTFYSLFLAPSDLRMMRYVVLKFIGLIY